MTRLTSALLALTLCSSCPALAADGTVSDVLQAASDDGLPMSPFQARLREGTAKGVPEYRITAALEALRHELLSGRELLGAEADVPSLIAAAAAVRAGAPAEAIAQIATAPPGVRTRALRALSDLIGNGFPPDEALRLVEAAAVGPDPDAAFTGLATAAATLTRRQIAPTVAVERLLVAIRASEPPLAVAYGAPSNLGQSP